MNKKQTVLTWTFSPSFYYYLTASLNMKGKGPLIANNLKRRQAGVKGLGKAGHICREQLFH